jgi:lipoprotein-releasing system permease protein
LGGKLGSNLGGEGRGGEGAQPPLPGIFLGQELAYEMGLIPGDQVTLISPTEFEGPVEGIPRLKRYNIEGVYHSGLPEQELHTVFARQAGVYSFLRKSAVVSQWEITVKDFSQAPEIASEIRASAPGFRVQDWVQMNSHLFASLKLERMSMFVILAFIIIVASFNIVTTLTLMVLEKKKEISILKAMGARNGQVAAIFLAEGVLIGGVGVGGGVLLGFLLCAGLKRYEFITLPDIYYDRTLPVTFDLKYYVVVSVCALLIVLGACLYPSRRAAKLDPLEGIRFG